MTFAIGDRVLWRYSMPPLGVTYEVTDVRYTPIGSRRVALKLASHIDDPAVGFAEGKEADCCAVPEGWEEAPDCPACRFGKWDGATPDDNAMHAWYNASLTWHKKHRLPLMVRMGWYELQDWGMPK